MEKILEVNPDMVILLKSKKSSDDLYSKYTQNIKSVYQLNRESSDDYQQKQVSC